MTCYMDRMFCSERDCETECYRRFFGTEHAAQSELSRCVSFGDMRGTAYCKGYTTKEVTPCSATDANTAP